MKLLIIFSLLVAVAYARPGVGRAVRILVAGHIIHKTAEELGVPSSILKVEHNAPDEVYTDNAGREYTLIKEWVGSTPVLAKKYKDNGELVYLDNANTSKVVTNENNDNVNEVGSGYVGDKNGYVGVSSKDKVPTFSSRSGDDSESARNESDVVEKKTGEEPKSVTESDG